MSKFKVVVIHSLGPYSTLAMATSAKGMIKAKIPKIAFSKTSKSSRGYSFTGRITYVKAINSTVSVVRAAIQKAAPKARVNVSLIK